MKVEQIEQEALALSESQRVTLVSKLLDTLPPAGTDISDEEVDRRERDMASGNVSAISHDEFARRVKEDRGR